KRMPLPRASSLRWASVRECPLRSMRRGRIPDYLASWGHVSCRDHAGHSEDDRHQRNRTPPVLPECCNAVGAFTSSPEDAEQRDKSTKQSTDTLHRRSVARLRRTESAVAWASVHE